MHLQGKVDSVRGKGAWKVSYLLERNLGKWTLINAYTGVPVTQLKIITWTFGIKTIEGVCPVSF